nr:MBL fold metallo-hydrolase [uncultured Flavobacterium sp.]
MNLIIHRGTNEIGGSCIELQSENSRILLDFGMPLLCANGMVFNFKEYENLSVRELVSKNVLPDVKEAYSANSKIDGLIISHAHADHYGLMHYVDKDIPIWIGEATHEILKLNNIFLNQHNVIEKPNYFQRWKKFQIGDFTITPYWNDHSAFDTYSFLIEANGKKVWYSSDFRSHGRKKEIYKKFIENPPKNVDCLIMEGTTIGRDTITSKTEVVIENEFYECFKNSTSINYVCTSAQNIDRLVSIYKACLKAGKTFVVDVYGAHILEKLSGFAKLPTLFNGYPNMGVYFYSKPTTKLINRGYQKLVYKYTSKKMEKEEIVNHPSDYVLLVRTSMIQDLKSMNVKDGNLIYSMWPGYKDQPKTKEFIDVFINNNFKIIDIHTSGHADIEILREYANAINPKVITPIHTNNKNDYKSIFDQPILELDDNQSYAI